MAAITGAKHPNQQPNTTKTVSKGVVQRFLSVFSPPSWVELYLSKAISLANKLNFTKPEELEEWLKDKPVEWAQVIAVRTALRVLPLVGRGHRQDLFHLPVDFELVLLVFRACFISSVARKYPAEDMVNAAADAGNAAADAGNASAYAADAANATNTAVDAGNAAAADAARAADTAADIGASDAAHAARAAADIWSEISNDVNWLASRLPISRAADMLMNTRLWPDGEPEWMSKERSELTQALMDQSKHHLVWINWYLSVIMGKPFFSLSSIREKALTLKIAQQENEFWEQDFAKISKDISEWLEQARIDDVGDATQRQLDEEEQVGSTESNSTNAKTPNPKTKPSIQLVDQNLLQVCTNIEAIKSISSERLEAMPAKPNSGEALEDWNKQREILTIIKEKSLAISESLQTLEKHNDRSLTVAETTGLLDELFQEFESFVITNKTELVSNFVRTGVPIILCGLAALVGASMVTATPAIFAMVGGEKIYNLLTKKNGKSDK